MSVGTAILGATALSAGAGIYGANKAASAQQSGAQAGTDATLAMYNQSRADLEPYRTTGTSALMQLADYLGIARPANFGGSTGSMTTPKGFEETPGYQYRFNEGQKAVNTAAASQGLFNSGARAKALQDRGQAMASEEFHNYLSRLAGVAGVGQGATTQTANTATSTGNTLAQLAGNQANARASGYVGGANAVTGGLNNLAFLYGMGKI
jgi:hypothetical protein